MDRKLRLTMNIGGVLVIFLLIMGLMGLSYNYETKEHYESDDPLHGSYLVTNGKLAGEIYPSDFLVSIDVSTDHNILTACAMEKNIDLSEGCWVYCFAENRIFEAEKNGLRLKVYENGVQIGTFICNNDEYFIDWRGEEYCLKKQMQAFIFP